MTNPRYVRVSSDDVMWFYDYNPASAVEPGPFVDPDLFFDRNVFGGSCATPPKPYQIFRSRQVKADGMVQFSGVCGTPLIIACGFPMAQLDAFREWQARKSRRGAIESTEWAQFIRESSQMAPLSSPATFWPTFEERLARQPGRSGGIDFYFFEHERQVYIHLELGSDREFGAEYFVNLSLQNEEDRVAFARWLTQGKEIPRMAYSVNEAGEVNQLANVVIGDIKVQDASFQSVDLQDTPICPEGCSYRACSIMAAGITAYDPSAGSAGFDLEVVALKSYCVDSDGEPCA